jgi:hypothetical protein
VGDSCPGQFFIDRNPSGIAPFSFAPSARSTYFVTEMPTYVLLLEDHEGVAELLCDAFREAGYRCFAPEKGHGGAFSASGPA